MSRILKAGAAITDITPKKSLFLYGYPHVERMSAGAHDPLYASALVLDNGRQKIVMGAVDIIYITKEIAQRVREKVSEKINLAPENIMISASHTHSGPMTIDSIFDDPAVPKADKEYVDSLCHKIAAVILRAHQNLVAAEIAITTTDGTGIGGNRREKNGVTDSEIPIIVLRDIQNRKILALSTTYGMHPTVLHEDSKLYSADFPGYTRQYIANYLGKDAVYLYHTGPEGDQSTRHFINGNTFEEAKRLGYMLGQRIVNSVNQVLDSEYKRDIDLTIRSKHIMLPKKQFPSLEDANFKFKEALQKYQLLKSKAASPKEIRTAECDVFGAEELLSLAQKSQNGEIATIYDSLLPVEIQAIGIHNRWFVCLPGELFVEYSLKIKKKANQKTFVICLANGILRGYIVTLEAYQQGGYEASNSMFPPAAGEKLVSEAVELIG